MDEKESKQFCESHKNMEKHVIETAMFIGQTTEATSNIKADVKILFTQNGEIIKGLGELKEEIAGIKIKLFGIGIAGAGLLEFALVIIKTWGHG